MKTMKLFSLLLILSLSLFATPLHRAVKAVDEKEVHTLVKMGLDINAMDKEGKTPLHYAASIGRYSLVKYLVEHGASVYIKDSLRKTPLVYAIEKNHIKVIIYLSKKANKEEAPYKINGLFDSAKRGDMNAMAYFLEYHDINTLNEDGKTALHIACEAGQYEIVSYLLDSGADMTILDDDGREAINYAKLSGYKKIIILISEYDDTKSIQY